MSKDFLLLLIIMGICLSITNAQKSHMIPTNRQIVPEVSHNSGNNKRIYYSPKQIRIQNISIKKNIST